MPLDGRFTVTNDDRECINNIWSPNDEGKIYCHKVGGAVVFSQQWLDRECANCAYMFGSNQGMGIECAYPIKWPSGRRAEKEFASNRQGTDQPSV